MHSSPNDFNLNVVAYCHVFASSRRCSEPNHRQWTAGLLNYRRQNDEPQHLFVEHPTPICHSSIQNRMACGNKIKTFIFSTNVCVKIKRSKLPLIPTCPPPSGKRIVSSNTTLYPLINSSFPSWFFCFNAFGSQMTTFDSNCNWKW